MSQNIIDVGAAPNDGTGDPLRNAFIAINENFDQIWSNGPVNSNVRIANNSITTTNINGNLVLAPSGIGITQVKSSIVPAVDNVYDLGSPTARFNTIYLGSGGLELAGNLNVDYYFGNGRFLSGVLAAAAPNIVFGGTSVNIPSANANVVFTVNNIQSLEVGATQTIFFRPIVSNSTVSTSGNITSAANVNAVGISATTVAAAGLAVSANTTTGNLSVVGSVIANTVNSTGNITFVPGGNLVFSNAVVNWLANPVQAQDAATKFYVDSVAQGLDVKASVLLATATTLPTYVYNNGTDGVGATITATTNGLLSIDSTAVSANARVLIKNEVGSNQPYNGIYIVTNTGNATAQFVLTRSTDFDLPSEIPSAFTFIETGATNADTGYVCITNSPVTIGTTNIVWQQFSGAGSYTAGIGLSLNGTQFFISNTGVTANTYGSSSSIPVLTVDPRGQITNATTASINAPAGSITGNTLSSNVLISSLTAVGTLGQLSVSGNVDANNLNSLQVVSAAGNVVGGNITTAGVITASGNVVGGNISTTGLVTATGNVNGGNINTAGGVTATGNVVGGNITTAGVITASGNIISAANVNAANVNSSGNISAVGNIASGNVVSSGRISASGNVESAANINGANINASGNVSVTGNVNASNFSTTGNIAVGNLSITGIISATGNIVSSANVNAANVNSSGNISATGNVNSGNVSTTGSITAAQNISATGNVSGATLNSSGIVSAVGNVNTTANVNAGNINATGTISSTGNISATGNLQGNNLSVTNLVNASGNVTGANITTDGLITAVGNITSTSNVAAGNIVSQGLVTAVGNIVTNANVNAANLNATESLVAVGNVVGGNLTTGGRVTATGNIVSSANISGGNLLSTGIVSATSNVIGGNINTGGRVDATGNVSGGNLTTAGRVDATGNVSGANVITAGMFGWSGVGSNSRITNTGSINLIPDTSYDGLAGVQIGGSGFILGPNGSRNLTLNYNSEGGLAGAYRLGVVGNQTEAITNYGSNRVGTIGNATTYFGNAYLSNIFTGIVQAANITSSANISGNFVAAGSNRQVMFNDNGLISSSSLFTFDKAGPTLALNNSAGTVITGYLSSLGGSDLNITPATNNLVIWGSANPRFSNSYTLGTSSFQWRNVWAGNANIGALSVAGISSFTGNLSVTANVSAGNISTAGLITATGNITGGNIITGGLITATGNIDSTANVTGGNIITGGLITATANITSSANIQGANLITAGIVTATGNVVGGNVNTAGIITATGNVIGGNITTAGIASVTGNVIGGNITTAGIVTATGNVIGANLNTAGAVDAAGNITGGNLRSNNLVSAVGNVIGGNVNTAGIVTATGNVIGGNISTAGRVDATANITGGNLISGGLVSAAANVVGANLNTTGAVDATGNVTGGNVRSDGIVSAVGNVTGANLNTVGNVTATGNVIGGNFVTNGNVFANSVSGGTLTLYASGNILISAAGNRIDMGGHEVVNVGYPNSGSDAATKQYVDDAVSAGFHIHDPVDLETPTPLPSATYALGGNVYTVTDTIAGNTVVFSTAANLQINDQLWFANSFQGIVANTSYFVISTPNTSAVVLSRAYAGEAVSNITSASGLTQSVRVNSGVGATLTAIANGALSVDGISVSSGNRILVYTQANAVTNGVYTVSDTGNATAPWILTRATDSDEYKPDSNDGMDQGSYYYVKFGNTGAGESYVLTAPAGPFLIGYANVEFTQFSASQVYSANTQAGLTLTGTTFAAKVDNNTTAFDAGGNIKVKDGANLTTPNIGAATGTSLSVSGNVTAGNFDTVGAISASGNILSSNVFATGTVSGNIVTGNSVSASGNVTGANINTNGLVSAAGNVISGNVSTGNVAAANINTGYLLVNTSTGANIIGGNLTLTEVTGAGGAISAQGNVTANNINANNISLTGNVLSNLRVDGNVDVSGTVDIANSLTADSLLVDTVGGITANSGNITINEITGQGGYLNAVGANLSANIAAGNVNTGNISLTGNVLSDLNVNGNVDIAGTVGVANSFTADSILVDTVGGITANGGNIVINQITGQGGYLNALGANLSANVIAGNVNTGNISLTGNVLSNLRVNGNVGIAGIVDIANSLTVDSILVDTVGGIVANGGNITINQITGQGGNLNAVGISVSGNISGNNITLGNNLSTTGNITAGYFIGDGSQLTNVSVAAGSFIENGNSNVIVAANGNVSIGTYGTIPAVFANTGLYVTGLISATGNVDVGSTLNVTSNAAVTGNISGGNISASGNITGTYFFGNGSQLSGIITSVANINNGTSNLRIDTAGGNIQANVAGTANIFTITTSGIQTSGNASANNLSVSNVANIGVLSVAGNISANGVVTVDGNVTAANLISNGTVSAQGNVIGGNINTAGVVSATGNVVSVANVSGGNVLSSLLISAAGNVTGANITSNGAVIALGNVTGGNVNSDGIVSAAGNIVTTANVTGGNLLTSGVLNLTGGTPYNTATLSGGNIILNNGAGDTPGLHFYQGNNDNFGIDVENGTLRFVKNLDEAGGSVVGRVDANGNIIAVGQLQGASASVSGNVTGGNVITGGFISATGNITGNYFFGNGSQLSGIITSVANINNGTSNIRIETSGGNIQANVGGTANVWTLASTGEYVTGEISASGNVTGGNIATGGRVTATGNIISTANVTGANITTGGLVTATGNIVSNANVTGGNITTAGLVTATGNITSGSNIAGGNLSATTAITASGNITGGNVLTGGLISATGNISSAGNITGNFFFGNGSQLSGIITSVANINNGNSNVRIDSAGGNVSANVGGTADVLVLANTGAYVTGEVSASGNITGNFFIGNGSQLTGIASGGFTTLNVIGNAASYVSGNVTLQASTTSGNLIPQAGNGIQMVGNATTNNLVISIIGSLNDGTIWGGGGDCELVTGSVDPPSYDNGSITVSPTSEYDLGELPQPTATTTFSDVPPTAAVVGDMWIDSDSGILYLYFNDGSGSQWAEMASVYSIDEGPNLGNIGVDLIPSTNATYTLGNSSNRWLNAFVSSNVNTGNLISTGIVSATGNMSGGNIITTGLISATGNVSGANINASGLISATGNVSAGNINASGLISATGIVSANSQIVLNSYFDAPEGGQLVMAYRGIGGLTGQGNGTWNLDVNSSNAFRIFTQDASGAASVPITITSNTLSVSGNISDSKGEIRLVPENAQTTTYTLALTDHGKYISSNANVAVPNSIFSSGQSVTIYNNSASSITIVQNTGVTMYQVGTATTGNRTLAQRGLATVFCVGVNIFVITGGGLS